MMKPARIETVDAITFAGRNGTFEIGPSPGIKDLWEKFMTDYGRIEGQVGTQMFGVCHNFDGKGMMDYMAAVQVKEAGQVPGYMFTLDVPKRKVAVFAHEGALDTISETWAKIFSEGLPNANLKVAPGPQFEAYPEDMGEEGSTSIIEIHIPVA
jgi:AraC family transcriptional regulator